MRDKKRINRICKLIESRWSRVDQQRFGQFTANYIFGHHTDPFFLSDEETEKRLKELGVNK